MVHRDNHRMNNEPCPYRGYRHPASIISYAVWAYFRFSLSLRDVEDLLAERGIIVSYETIRQWCTKFGSLYARRLRKRRGTLGDHWHLDECVVRIQGAYHYLWRAVDQDGDVIDVLLQKRRNGKAARRFFRKLLKGQERSPNRVVMDKLGSYRVTHREEMPTVPHDTTKHHNNRAENSHQHTRRRERQMQRFKSVGQAQCFLSAHGKIHNLFRYGRHLMRAVHHRAFRAQAFAEWSAISLA